MQESYEQLLSEIRKLQSRADALRNKERSAAISEARSIIRKYDLNAAELGLAVKPNGRAPTKSDGKASAKLARKFKVPAKYKGPKGEVWSGRGITPVWLREALAKGKKKDDFLIKRN